MICETCGGSGTVHSHNPKCWDCNGTGQISDETYAGPGEEDGPWAEGWEERCGKLSAKELPCAGCGNPAQEDDGLCAECAKKLDELACSFEGRKNDLS